MLQLPIQTADVIVHTEFASPGNSPDNPFVVNDTRDAEVDQVDFTVTLGYNLWEGLSIFSGYKYTEFDVKAKEPGFLNFGKDQNYTEQGLFIGASYTWQVATAGTFSLSLGYAQLDNEFTESNIPSSPPNMGISLGEFAFSGSADGISYGAVT